MAVRNEQVKVNHDNYIPKAVKMFILIIGFICFCSIAILLLFFIGSPYPCRVNHVISNGFLMLPAFVLILLFAIYIKKHNNYRINEQNIDRAVKISLPFVYGLQLFMFSNLYFESGWDAEVISNLGRSIAYGYNDYISAISAGYLSRYQNNLLLSLISGLLLKINSFTGIFQPENELMAFVIVNCIISLLSAYLVYKILRILLSDCRFALVGYIITVFLCTLSPWNVITYSDPFCLLFPVLVLYLYIKPKINKYIRWGLITIVGYLGYCIKPTVLIIFIAILGLKIVNDVYLLVKRKKEFLKGLSSKVLTLVMAFFIILILNSFLNSQYEAVGLKVNNDKKFSLYHYLMMGQNETTNGSYYEDDVVFSMSFADYEARKEAAREIAVATG